MEMVEIAQGYINKEENTKGRENRSVSFPAPINVLLISRIDPLAEDTLQLGVEITCASPPHSRVVCCSSCQGREVCISLSSLSFPIESLQRQNVSPESWPSVCAPSGMILTPPRPQMLRPMVRPSRSTSFNSIALKSSASPLALLSFHFVSLVTVVTTASELVSMFTLPCPITLAESSVLGLPIRL